MFRRGEQLTTKGGVRYATVSAASSRLELGSRFQNSEWSGANVENEKGSAKGDEAVKGWNCVWFRMS